MKSRKGQRKRFWSGVLALAVALTLTGCGKGGGENPENPGLLADSQEEPEMIEAFVAEKIEMDIDQWMTNSSMYMSFYEIMPTEAYLYYTICNEWDEETGKYGYRYYRYDISKGASEQVTKVLHGLNGKYNIGEDGSIYDTVFQRQMETDQMQVVKYDAAGEEIYNVDLAAMTDVPAKGEAGELVAVCVESDGRVCLVCGKRLIFLDAEGGFLGSMDPTDGKTNLEVRAAGRGKDGKLYVRLQALGSVKQNILQEVDFEKREFYTLDEDFTHSGSLCPGLTGELLYNNSYDDTVYDYNVKEKTTERLFCWTDFGYRASNVRDLRVTSDGKILAVLNDTNSMTGTVLLFSKALVPERQEIVLGVVGATTVMQEGVAKFNKASSKYRVVIRDYLNDRQWSQEAAEDAWAQMGLELVAGKGPDVINLHSSQMQTISRQGFLEDLEPYLEQSSVLRKESFVGRVLEGGVCDGRLTAIPKQFQVITLVGRASDVGTKAGWTLDEFMNLVEQKPGVQVLSSSGKRTLLNVCTKANMDDFVDRNTGKCSFDSPEFIRLLEFVDRYGDVTTDGGDSSMGFLVERLRRGDILLNNTAVDQPGWIQICDEKFAGDACIVGYPSKNGSATHYIWIPEMLGIAANSQCKAGAWTFLEYVVNARYPSDMYDFPAVQSCLDDLMQEESSDVAYKTDEDGKLILDEDGNPIPIPKIKHSVRYDNWEFEYKTLTAEEAARLKEIFDTAIPESMADKEIQTIIDEETAEFFEGSKSAEQVADVIQSRVQLYMNENM